MTTKGLRIILMSKSSRHIWKSCLAKVTDIPNCPPDLTEPEFVRLLFTTACYVSAECQSARKRKRIERLSSQDCGTQCGLYDYYYRLLYCDSCFQTKYVPRPLVSFPAYTRLRLRLVVS